MLSLFITPSTLARINPPTASVRPPMDFSSSSSFTSFSSSSSDIEAACAPPDDDDAAADLIYQYRHPPPPSSTHGLRSQRPPPWPMTRFFFDSLDVEDDEDEEEPRHFLDACFLCRKSLPGNRDIFMYRGDLPFCSRECREKQIETEVGKEKNGKKLTLKAASSSRKLEANKGRGSGGDPSSPPKSHGKVRVRAGGAAVVAAG